VNDFLLSLQAASLRKRSGVLSGSR